MLDGKLGTNIEGNIQSAQPGDRVELSVAVWPLGPSLDLSYALIRENFLFS